MRNSDNNPTVTNCTFSGNSLLYCQISTPDPCPADVDGNSVVDVLDFVEVLANRGPCS